MCCSRDTFEGLSERAPFGARGRWLIQLAASRVFAEPFCECLRKNQPSRQSDVLRLAAQRAPPVGAAPDGCWAMPHATPVEATSRLHTVHKICRIHPNE